MWIRNYFLKLHAKRLYDFWIIAGVTIFSVMSKFLIRMDSEEQNGVCFLLTLKLRKNVV